MMNIKRNEIKNISTFLGSVLEIGKQRVTFTFMTLTSG